MARFEGSFKLRARHALRRAAREGSSSLPSLSSFSLLLRRRLTFPSFFLSSQETVERIETIANKIHADRNPGQFKKALIKGLPRQGIIKPAHAIYRLQAQVFRLGDRVVMVQDSGAAGVPLSLKGVVVGINSTTVDVVWDSPFISGTTLGGR